MVTISKTLLVVGGGVESIPGLERARQLGLRIVVSDANPNAPGAQFADDRIVASTYDINATVEAAQRYHSTMRSIDGVMSIASDIPLTIAAVAKALNLPGISLESARLASDKLAMKQKFAADGVPVPWFSAIESLEQLRGLISERGYPLVIKPVDSRGARGVIRLTEVVDIEAAYASAKHESPTGRAMIEQFLDGPQISTESIVLDGVAHTPGFADRNYELLEKFAPNIIEDGCDLPSQLDEREQELTCEVVQQAADSMGIRNGVVKGDMVVHRGKAYVIELAARLSGGLLCSNLIPLNTGVDFVGAAIRLAVGEPVLASELVPQYQHCVSQRYMFPKPGHVLDISGEVQASRLPGIEFCQIRVKPGDIVGPMNSHPARAGMVIAVGNSHAQAIQRARAAVGAIKIETVPLNVSDPVGAH